MSELIFGAPNQSKSSRLKDILTRHTNDYIASGVYQAWIGVVGKYYDNQNTEGQEELDRFAATELPLAAITKKNCDRRYPGINSHYLIKVNPDTGARIKLGMYGIGLEPIIVAFADETGGIFEREDAGHRVTPYTADQVKQVIEHAQELESAGYNLTT